MPKRPVFQTSRGSVGHWSQGNEGLITECGADVYGPAPRIRVMNCKNCDRVVKTRRGRSIRNAARAS